MRPASAVIVSIVLERHGDGHDRATAWTQFSVTKSVTSLLFGVAIKSGFIGSLDEPVTRHLQPVSQADVIR